MALSVVEKHLVHLERHDPNPTEMDSVSKDFELDL
jgi:hypothetical protein